MAQFHDRLDAQQIHVSLPEGRRGESLKIMRDQIFGLRRESGGHLVCNYC